MRNLLKRSAAWAVVTALVTPSMACAEVHIGLAGPQTGQYASFFEQMQRGAELAVEDLNKAGGIRGEKVVLDIGDDACDPRQAVSVANQMVQRKVLAVIGHFCSSSSIPAASVYAAANVLMITPASTNPALTERGFTTVFRVCGRDDQQAAVIAKEIIGRKLGTNVAFVDDRSTYGKGLADGVRTLLNQSGIHEKLVASVAQGDKDFSALITRLKSAGVDLVFFGGYHIEAGLLVRQAREQGLEAKFVGGDGLANKDLTAIAGPASEGVLFAFYPDPRKNPGSADLVERFRAAKYEPEGFTLYTYAAFQTVSEAAKRAKAAGGAELAAAIRAEPVNTVLGRLTFNAKGDPNSEPFVLYAFKNNEYGYAN